MKKQAIFVLILAALVVGSAFAQKVGDTVTVFGDNYTVRSVSGNTVTLEKVVQAAPLPEGEYLHEHGGGSANRSGPKGIRISGNTGFVTNVTDGQGSVTYKRAIDVGMLKLGDPVIRNIRHVSGNEYSCEILFVNGTGQRNRDIGGGSNPFTPTGTEWRAAKLTVGPYLNNPRNPPGFQVEGWHGAGAMYSLQR